MLQALQTDDRLIEHIELFTQLGEHLHEINVELRIEPFTAKSKRRRL